MRRVLVPVVLAVGLVAAAAGGALAQPATDGAAPPAVPGDKVCTITDDRLVEVSGMVATAGGYVVVNDSSDLESRQRVFFLGPKCGFREGVRFPSSPRDPEDLALSPDGRTLWVADIGDNDADRETVALWKMPADGSSRPEIFRMSYPDGARDAEALLVGADGVPIIITKGAKAALYKASGELRKGVTTPLQKVGEVTLPRTTTANPLGPAGRLTVTGAAAAPDGSRVVLRTYADAFEWDVDGDIVAALTGKQPRITPLPDEPRGEAITYSSDGATLLTVSETAQQEGLQPVVLRYTPARAVAKAAPAQGGAKNGGGGSTSLFTSPEDFMLLIGAFGLVGVLLVVAGVVGIVRSRREQDAEPNDAPDDEASAVPVRGVEHPAEQATEFLARVRPDDRYAGGTPGFRGDPDFDEDPAGGDPRSGRGPAYGPEPAGGRTGGVYGGARAGGPAYGPSGGRPGAVYGAYGPASGAAPGAGPASGTYGPGAANGGYDGGAGAANGGYDAGPDHDPYGAEPANGVYGPGSSGASGRGFGGGRAGGPAYGPDPEGVRDPGHGARPAGSYGGVYGGPQPPDRGQPAGGVHPDAYRGGAYAGDGYSGGGSYPGGNYADEVYVEDESYVEQPAGPYPPGYDDPNGYGYDPRSRRY